MAQMLVLVISDEEKLERILEGFMKIGIRGATIIDSVGMGRFLAHTMPFASLNAMINGNREINKTVFAVSKHESKIQQAIALIKRTMGELVKPDSGFVFVISNIDAFGFASPFEGDEGE